MSRQREGASTTSKMKDGIIRRGATWSYVVRVPNPETGRTKPTWVGPFPTERAAKAARDETRVLCRRGTYVDRSAITVAGYLREWLVSHSVAVKPTTLSTYRTLVEFYVIPRIGGMRVQGVRPATFSRLYRDLLEGGSKHGGPLSPRTVQAVHRMLSKAFRDAVRVEQIISTSPVENATRPRVRPVDDPVGVWSADELRTFLAAASEHRLGAFYRLAAYTGARRGELLFLRWKDLDLETAAVTFAGSTAVVDRQRVEGTTKADRSRVVSIDGGTVDVMRRHRKAQVAERLAVGDLWCDDDDLVFRRPDGAALYPSAVSALMGQLATRAGLPPTRLHNLRHVHATTLLLANVPVHVVADRLGHADPSITLRVYAHVRRGQAGNVANVFADAVAARAPERSSC